MSYAAIHEYMEQFILESMKLKIQVCLSQQVIVWCLQALYHL